MDGPLNGRLHRKLPHPIYVQEDPLLVGCYSKVGFVHSQVVGAADMDVEKLQNVPG